ncbi:MAG: universal stress protein [Nitrosopumilus sp.]|nr:universal stress protein [Nitrosopumilus sp.]MDH3489194.1 universal stress protein [Nitrosopumilus sp.]MDH3516193.1 universal stress protein [Nitrosopumilus sp.]MDH3565468.1 universal stress protein [Nitrosopumilus sp.]MDH5416957.1 universal stress protein [Nitrosopumilus sp.]
MIKNKIQKILVALDGSKNSFRGLDEAIIIARNSKSVISGTYVTPLSPPASSEQKAYVKNVLLKNANEFMEKAKTRCAQNGILFYEKILYGKEGPKIVKFAHDKKFDLIVIGSRGMSSLKEAFLGSTSNYVLHKSKIPVLIVK